MKFSLGVDNETYSIPISTTETFITSIYYKKFVMFLRPIKMNMRASFTVIIR